MTNPHLKMGIDSTPETLYERHFRQWIPSNKFMLHTKSWYFLGHSYPFIETMNKKNPYVKITVKYFISRLEMFNKKKCFFLK